MSDAVKNPRINVLAPKQFGTAWETVEIDSNDRSPRLEFFDWVDRIASVKRGFWSNIGDAVCWISASSLCYWLTSLGFIASLWLGSLLAGTFFLMALYILLTVLRGYKDLLLVIYRLFLLAMGAVLLL